MGDVPPQVALVGVARLDAGVAHQFVEYRLALRGRQFIALGERKPNIRQARSSPLPEEALQVLLLQVRRNLLVIHASAA